VYVITNEESQTIDHVVNIIIVDKGMKKRRVAKEITIVVIVAVVVIICVGA
jgi:tetraacyldisaccharide-1-P 4'-kinase